MAELLLELFGEEIPARMQARALQDLLTLLGDAFKANDLGQAQVSGLVTPRRLVVIATDLPTRQPDREIEKKGPKTDAPQAAIDGFLKSIGQGLDAVEVRSTPKGDAYFYIEKAVGRATAEVLPALIAEVLGKLPWPKSMRWADRPLRWVRPIHNILCLFEGAVVPVSFGHLVANDETRGHRFLSPSAFKVSDAAGYRQQLAANKVMVDQAERRALILDGCTKLAASKGVSLVADERLLDEVTGLVEWPVPLAGRIPDAFMSIPEEVLIATMRDNQRYFVTRAADGKLSPHFLVVANIETADQGAAIVAGNERVLRARLSDAKFFWENDLKKSLDSRLPKLDELVFHAKLGSVRQKAERLAKLARALAAFIPGCDPAQAERAGLLAKADLVSEMVFEFPEVQGIMGRYYAKAQGEPEAVAEALAAHYSPLGPNDECPRAPVSVAVALADKLDTLVGFYAVGERPTGSKDPFALRRAALGIIRLITVNGLRLSLSQMIDQAAVLYGLASPKAEVIAFMIDRLKVTLKEQGVRHDLITAVFALGGEDDLVRLLARVRVLQVFLGDETGFNLLAAYRRAVNILRIEEKKDGQPISGQPDPALMASAEEKALYQALASVAQGSEAALAREDFAGAMAALAQLRQPVDAFFEKVTVNAEQAAIRQNRLRLLGEIRKTLHRIADFSAIEG